MYTLAWVFSLDLDYFLNVYICTQVCDERGTPSVTFQKAILKVLARQDDSLVNS